MTRIAHIKAKARRAERKHAWVVRGHVDDIKSIKAYLFGEFEEKLWKSLRANCATEFTWEDFLAEMERLETERKQAVAGTTSTPIQKPRKRHDLSPSPAKERSYMCLGSKGEREKGKGKFKAKGLQSLPSPYNRA